MFQFRRFPSYAYLIQRRMTEYCSAGFPHSVIPGSTLMCSSPRLIAACHDLLRLLMPRHSPCALSSLTSFGASLLAPPGSTVQELCRHFHGRSFWLIALPFKFPQFRLSRFPRLAVGLASFRLGLHLKPSASVSVLAPVHPNLLGGSALLKNPLLLALHFWNVFFVVQFSRCNF